MTVRNVPLISFIAAPSVLDSKEATTIVTRGDPHASRVVGVGAAAGISLGAATPLDMLANIHRTRRKPESLADPAFTVRRGLNLVVLQPPFRLLSFACITAVTAGRHAIVDLR